MLCIRDVGLGLLWLCLWGNAMGDVSQCLKDTFGIAEEGLEKEKISEPFERGVDKLKCDFQSTDPTTLKKFTLNYYPNIKRFADWDGFDMVPELHSEYPKDSPLLKIPAWVPGQNGPPQTERPQLQHCSIPQEDGGAYIIQRVGPLVSVGDYDYWQFGWQDTFQLSKVLAQHPDGIMFTSSFSGPVKPTGEVIGHPPIHIHHIHISPAPGTVTKLDGKKCVTQFDPSQCYTVNLAVEQHGDYQCTEADGGLDCFFERPVDGYSKILTTPVDLEGELNDVRAPNSEPMTWYYQVVLRWHPRTPKFKPISQQFHTGPGQMKSADQRHNVLVFPSRAREHNMYWYSGRMEIEGMMKRNKLHAHNTMFNTAFWFHGLPADLGLDDPKFMPQKTYIPHILSEIGYDNFEQFRGFILEKLTVAAAKHDAKCEAMSSVDEKAECKRTSPKLVCQSWVENEDFEDPVSKKMFAYDRRAPCCCRPWHFKKGDPFTVVSFLNPMTTPPGPWSPDVIPEKGNMHVHWVMTFDTMDNVSHYRHTTYVQNTERQMSYGDGMDGGIAYPVADLIQHMNQQAYDGEAGQMSNKYPFYDKNDWRFQMHLKLFQWLFAPEFIWEYYSYRIVAVLLSFFLCSCWCFVRCFLCCKRRIKRAQDHPAVKCVQQTPCCPDGATKVAEVAVKYAEVVQHDD